MDTCISTMCLPLAFVYTVIRDGSYARAVLTAS